MTCPTRWRSIAAVSVACLVLAAAPVASSDLSGTWAGKISCKGIFNGKAQTVTSSPTLLVDDAASLELAVDGVHYTAVLYAPPEHPEKGELALIRCDTDSTRSGGEFGGEFGRMKVRSNASKGTGSLNGTSFKASVLIAQSLYTCRWAFKRISTAHVALDPCAPSPVQ